MIPVRRPFRPERDEEVPLHPQEDAAFEPAMQAVELDAALAEYLISPLGILRKFQLKVRFDVVKICVITSYSIHYTKLYDIGLSNFQEQDIDNILKSCSVAPVVNQILAHVSNTRITSYNVCYTKLLRLGIGMEQVTGLGDSGLVTDRRRHVGEAEGDRLVPDDGLAEALA